MSGDIPNWILRPIAALAERWDWLGRKLNGLMIDRLVNYCRHRPHPWSTVHDYVSWTSLSDQRWSARHLPAYDPPGPLPDAQHLTELFRRPADRQQPCEKSTVLFPAFAQYLTDGIIRTQMPSADESEDLRKRNTSNHQIDLCPLYGRTAEQTGVLRLSSNVAGQRGRLKSQWIDGEEYAPFYFQDDGNTAKIEFTPLDPPLGISKFPDPQLRAKIFAFGGDRANASPQVAMMNTLFLREHNRVAAALEAANASWDDERVFQTARNTVIVVFIKIVVEEYINHISQVPLRFRADPAVAWKAAWNKPNWITTEFSLLYRWHSLIPDIITWHGQPYPVAATLMNHTPLIKSGLARAFSEVSAQRAGRIGPFNTALPLLDLEKLAIEQGRRCRLAPYAAYREYCSLPRPKSFEDISKNPNVAAFLKAAYRGPEDVDFYVGLFAEDAVENSPLPPLLLRFVAVDAFSQALSNPLLSEHVFNEATFSRVGWEAILETETLADIVARNSRDAPPGWIGMTRPGWEPR